MVRVTMIARLGDGLPLCEGVDVEKSNDLDVCKGQAKTLIRKLGNTNRPEPKLSYESGPFVVHYMIEGSVVYLVVCDRKYPKKLAFKYLEEIKQEFENLYRGQVDTVVRPYAFIKFDTFIQKTRKLYMDTRAQRNMMKLSEELSEVQQIMTRNIQEVLGQGEKLDRTLRAFRLPRKTLKANSASMLLKQERIPPNSKDADLFANPISQMYLGSPARWLRNQVCTRRKQRS